MARRCKIWFADMEGRVVIPACSSGAVTGGWTAPISACNAADRTTNPCGPNELHKSLMGRRYLRDE
jgi:hypothetical protein